MSDFTFDKYKAVAFDLDSTLTDTHRYPLRASMWLLEQVTDDVESVAEQFIRHLVNNYREEIESVARGAPYQTPYEIVKQAMLKSLNQVGLDSDESVIDEGTRLFRWLHVETSTILPGVERFLQLLQERGLKLGVVTNSFEKHLQIILAKLRILQYFHCLVDGSVVKAFKPMKEPFEYLIDCLGTNVAETLFIGDEYYADIVGATSLGMDAVWINSRGDDLERLISKYGESSRPILVVESLSELESYLQLS